MKKFKLIIINDVKNVTYEIIGDEPISVDLETEGLYYVNENSYVTITIKSLNPEQKLLPLYQERHYMIDDYEFITDETLFTKNKKVSHL